MHRVWLQGECIAYSRCAVMLSIRSSDYVRLRIHGPGKYIHKHTHNHYERYSVSDQEHDQKHFMSLQV